MLVSRRLNTRGLWYVASWHHNHHAFPRSDTHGLRWWEVDIGGVVIRLMRRLGLAWKVVQPTADMQRRREALAE